MTCSGIPRQFFLEDGGLRFFAEFEFELCRGQVLQAAVGTYLVVVIAPGFDQGSGFAARTEPLDGQTLVAELAVEAFVGAVLPGLAGIVEHGGNARG